MLFPFRSGSAKAVRLGHDGPPCRRWMAGIAAPMFRPGFIRTTPPGQPGAAGTCARRHACRSEGSPAPRPERHIAPVGRRWRRGRCQAHRQQLRHIWFMLPQCFQHIRRRFGCGSHQHAAIRRQRKAQPDSLRIGQDGGGGHRSALHPATGANASASAVPIGIGGIGTIGGASPSAACRSE